MTLANLAGIATGMALIPLLVERMMIPDIQLIYGGIAAFSAILFIIFARERPAIPPCPPGMEARALMLGILLAIPGLIGLAFAKSAWLLFASAFEMGFFLVSTSPVGMQYAAEITYPTPEGTSNGLIPLFGQASVVFIYIMKALPSPNGSFSMDLLLAVILLVVSAGLVSQMKDPSA